MTNLSTEITSVVPLEEKYKGTFAENDLKGMLVSESQLKEKVKEIGKQITEDYRGKDLLAIVILKGSVIFASDLLRETDLPCDVDFMAVSSYGSGTKSSGVVKIIKDLNNSIEGRDVLIIEDILDSGITLSHLKELLSTRKPKSLEICTLLDKPYGRKTQIEPKYSGFVIPDEYVVGYGLDFDEIYRNLPFVGSLKPEVYEK